MVTRRSRTTASLVGTALVLAAGVLVVRHFTAPSEPELPTIPAAERPVVEAAARACPKVPQYRESEEKYAAEHSHSPRPSARVSRPSGDHASAAMKSSTARTSSSGDSSAG
ncbi:hypothetical protein AB4Z54_25060 [Streptomyces sp. MCAF7]